MPNKQIHKAIGETCFSFKSNSHVCNVSSKIVKHFDKIFYNFTWKMTISKSYMSLRESSILTNISVIKLNRDY